MDTTLEEAITIYHLAEASRDAFAQVADAAEQVIATLHSLARNNEYDKR